MINLLPPSLKDALHKEEEVRFLWILCFLVSLFFVCLFLLLLSLQIYLKGAVNAKEILVDTYMRQTASHAALKNEMKTLNTTVAQIASFYEKQLKVSTLAERIALAVPQGVRLTFFQYIPSSIIVSGEDVKTVPAKVILSGFSSRRADLLSFWESLRKDSSFSHFDFPPSNWSKPVDLPFSFSFEISGL